MIRLITTKTKTVTRTVSWEMNWNNFHDTPSAVMNGIKEKGMRGMGRRNGKTNKRIKSYNHKEWFLEKTIITLERIKLIKIFFLQS